jgi:hypothetical protein
MVAAGRDCWQAGRVRRLARASMLATLILTAPAPSADAAGPGDAKIVQAPPGSADAPRVMSFSWTLYPRMWAELDLRLAAGAEAVAEVTADGGDVSWNLHTHPPDAPPTAFVTLAQGVASRATVRCAPDAPGQYSYLFGNDRNAGPVRLRIELRLAGEGRVEAVKP